MQLITTKEIIDVVKYNDNSAIIVEKLPLSNPSQYKVQYSVIDFVDKKIDLITKSAYLLKKFGSNFKRISEIIPNFVQCDALILYDKRVLALYPNGESGIFNRDGELDWNGSFLYHDKIVNCLANDGKYFWCVCTEENCVLRYSSQNMKVDLRIGGISSDTFKSPTHVSYFNGNLFVCCDNNKVRAIDANTFTVSDYLHFNNTINKFYKFGNHSIAIMSDGTYVIDNE